MVSTESIRDSAQCGEHHFYEWSGSAHEIGRQHGAALRDEIIREFSPALEAQAQAARRSEAFVLDRHRALYESLFEDLVPRAIEEIRGISKGAGLSYEQAFFAATRDGAKVIQNSEPEEGCTAFFCGRPSTADGNVLMGQTKDTPSPLSRYRIMRLNYDDGLSVLQLGYPGWIAHIGLSSHGLANTGNSLFAQPASDETVPFSLVKRLVMESKTVDDVLTATAKLTFENCCLILGSANDAGVCIEFVAGRRNVRDVSHEAFAHANSILAPELLPCQRAAADAVGDFASSPCRQRNMQQFLDTRVGRLNVPVLKEAMSDHDDYPHSICRHGAEGESRTTAAFIADLSAAKVHVSIGNPCAASFKEYVL